MEKAQKEKNKEDTELLSPEAAEESDDDVAGILSERLQKLSDAIAELDRALDRRQARSRNFSGRSTPRLRKVLRHLRMLNPPWKTGFLPELEFLGLSLHNSLTSRKKDTRSEELKYWEDVTTLVKEKRKALSQLGY